jgi:hypothetical protein
MRLLVRLSFVIGLLGVGLLGAPAANAQAGLTWTLSSPTVTEGDFGTTTAMNFTIALSAVSNTAHTFTFRTIGGDAVGGNCASGVPDFQAFQSGTLSIPANANPPSATFAITVCGDNWDEDEERVNVQVDRTAGLAFPPAIATPGRIQDDDTGGLTGAPLMSIEPIQIVEGNAGTSLALFTVSLSGVSQQPATASFSTINLLDTATTAASCATPNADLIGVTNVPVQIAAFQDPPTALVPVTICGDTRDEANEGMHVQLTNLTGAGCIVSAACLSTVAIVDDEPTFSIGPAAGVSVTEADTVTRTATLTLSVTGNNAGSSAQVRTVDGTARGGANCTSGADYVSFNRLVQVPQGSQSVNVDVTVCPDTLDEENEQLTVEITAANSGLIGANSAATVSILDNDAGPTMSIANASSFEEQTCSTQLCLPFNFLGLPVTLSEASGRTVTVNYRTREILTQVFATAAQGGPSCSAGIDYVDTTGTLTFSPGDVTENVLVRLCAENIDELSESFQVVLENPVNATLDDSIGVGTIDNNDNPELQVVDRSFNEGDLPGTVAITVRLSHTSREDVSFNFATRGSTATSGSQCNLGTADFLGTTGSRTIDNGDLSITVPVTLCGDERFEIDEVFFVDVTLAAGETDATVGDGTGAARILNDDPFGLPFP